MTYVISWQLKTWKSPKTRNEHLCSYPTKNKGFKFWLTPRVFVLTQAQSSCWTQTLESAQTKEKSWKKGSRKKKNTCACTCQEAVTRADRTKEAWEIMYAYNSTLAPSPASSLTWIGITRVTHPEFTETHVFFSHRTSGRDAYSPHDRTYDTRVF